MANQMARNKRLYERQVQLAHQDSSSWQFHYKNLLLSLNGTDEENQAVIRKRILRYFGEFKLDSESYFCERMELDVTNPFLQIVPHQILLYGIDYLSIDKAKRYFSGYPTEIKQLDDSHFWVKFPNKLDCLRAINSRSQRKYLSSEQLCQSSKKGWVEMKPYSQFIFQRKLMARYVTNFDKMDNIKFANNKNTMFYAYSEAKRKFMKNLHEDLLSRQMQKSRGQIKAYQSKQSQRSRQKQISRRQSSSESYECCCQCRTARMHLCDRCNKKRNFYSSRGESRQRNEASHQKSYPQRSANRSAKLEEQRQKQAAFKFERYIKNRDKISECKKDESEKRNPVNSEFFFQLSAEKGQAGKQPQDSSLADFEMFLQKLKLDDSSQGKDYSIFNLDTDAPLQ